TCTRGWWSSSSTATSSSATATRTPASATATPSSSSTSWVGDEMTDSTSTVEAAQALDRPLTIGGVDFTSRLIVGTGKYKTNQVMVDAIRATGAEMVTVAVRRVDLDRTKEEAILHHLDPNEFFLLANTAGCYT